MSAHLAAIDRILRAHLLFDEGMSTFANNTTAPKPLDDIERVPDQPRVVNDRFALLLAQQSLCDQANNVVALDKVSVLVEQEASIVIAIPRNAEIINRLILQLLVARIDRS